MIVESVPAPLSSPSVGEPGSATVTMADNDVLSTVTVPRAARQNTDGTQGRK
jgi:hypothetical protein